MVLSLLLAALLVTAAAAGQEADDELREFCPLYRVFFDEGSAHLGADDQRVIDNWITFARATHSPDNRFTIEAGTDAEGSAIANLNLSWRRGRAIMNYLQSRGFPPAISASAPWANPVRCGWSRARRTGRHASRTAWPS